MKKIKDFIENCRLKYQAKKEQKLLRIIVIYATNFYPISILDRPLLIFSRFNEKTVKAVADKLGYDFLLYPEKKRHCSIIIFSKKTGTSEGD